MRDKDITKPPWAIQNGLLLFFVAYLLLAGLVLYLSWRWALGRGWPSYPPYKSIWAWLHWVCKSWSIPPSQLAQGHWWLWPGRLSAALGGLAPLPLACWTGWWIAKPLPREIHLKGRRLSTNPREAAKEAKQECKIAGEGLLVHPHIPLSLDRETRHILACAATGGGKTVMMLPLIHQAVTRGDKLLINDSKNEFIEKLEKVPAAKGVITFSPWDKRCRAWDIAADVTNKADARTIAARLVPESSKDPMWGLAAQSILVSVICKYQQTKPGQWDLQDILTDVFSGYDNLREIVMQYNREGLYAVEDAQKTKTTQSFLITLSTFLSQVADLAEAWKGKPKISLRRWLLDPSSPECRAPACKYLLMGGSKRYAKLEQAYTQAIIAALASIVNSPEMPDSDTRKLWLFLDELPQLGEVTELSQFFEIGRSKGCRVVVGTQDVAQLRKIYSKDTVEAWTSMVGTYLIGRTGGRDTQKWLSELIGSRKIKKYRISYTRDPGASDAASGRQDAWEEVEEPVIRPEELSTTLGCRKNGMECLYLPGGDTVYRLIWPFPPKRKFRPVVVPAEWTEGPLPAPQISADVGNQGGESGQAPTPSEQQPKPATIPKEQEKQAVPQAQNAEPQVQQDQAHEGEELSGDAEEVPAPESPTEKVVEDLIEEAVEHVVDVSLPGAGAAVAAVDTITKAAEIVDPGQQPANPPQAQLINATPQLEDVWLEDDFEDEEEI